VFPVNKLSVFSGEAEFTGFSIPIEPKFHFTDESFQLSTGFSDLCLKNYEPFTRDVIAKREVSN
jgi:hypothetical protein